MGKPTEKQLAYAKRLASEAGIELPANAVNDFEACKEFIDMHQPKPSDKQLELAKKILEAGGPKPDKNFSLMNKYEVSSYIDANKMHLGNGDSSVPSQKMVNYAKLIASKLGVEEPDYETSFSVKEFLNKYSDEYNQKFPRS